VKNFITVFSVIAFAYANAEVVKDEAYYMKKHIIIGSDNHEQCADGEEPLKYDIEEKEFTLEEKVLFNELKRQNYKFPSQKEFEGKIYQIFGLKLNPNSNIVSCIYIHDKYRDECFENQIVIDWLTADSMVISKNKRFIVANLYRFPEIVNYQKKYPHILKMEKKLKKFEPCELGDKQPIKINRWKDIYKNGKIVQKNLDNFLHLNNYIFNDDKSKIPQVFNDNDVFFASLVSKYGYTKDKDLLDWYNKEFKTKIEVGEKLKLERDGEWFHQEKNK